MNDVARAAPREFSLTRGGPFNKLARRVGLIAPSGALRVWRFVLIAWVPLMVGSAIRVALGEGPDPIMLDISVHARFLVSLPLLVLSERLLEPQCRAAVAQLYIGRFADRSELDPVISRAERLRDTPWVEGVLALLAIAGGQLVIWGVAGPTGLFYGIERAGTSLSRIWYAAFALPFLQFLLLRWMWRWVIWSYILLRVAKLRLATTATHPDRAAGLGFLAAPVTAFAALVLAFSTLLAGAWGTQLLDGRVTVPALVPTLLLYLVIVFLLACGPLLPFSIHLFRARRLALILYSPFALDYVRRFQGKWIEHRTDEPVLGTPDIQSLSDLGNSYQAIEQTGMFVFGSRKLMELWLATIIPLLPLVATVVPIDTLLERLGSAMFGGFL